MPCAARQSAKNGAFEIPFRKEARAWADGAQPPVARRQIAALGQRLCKAWEDLPQFTAAVIEGSAVGGGLASDWPVLAEDALVSLPEIALGMPRTWRAMPALTTLVGPARAKRLTILCECIGGAQALAIGLVGYSAPHGGALAQARAVTTATPAMPAAAVRMRKETVNAVANAPYHLASHMGHDPIALAAGSADARSARAAALKPRG